MSELLDHFEDTFQTMVDVLGPVSAVGWHLSSSPPSLTVLVARYLQPWFAPRDILAGKTWGDLAALWHLDSEALEWMLWTNEQLPTLLYTDQERRDRLYAFALSMRSS